MVVKKKIRQQLAVSSPDYDQRLGSPQNEDIWLDFFLLDRTTQVKGMSPFHGMAFGAYYPGQGEAHNPESPS